MAIAGAAFAIAAGLALVGLATNKPLPMVVAIILVVVTIPFVGRVKL